MRIEKTLRLTAFIAEGSEPGLSGTKFLCFDVPLLVQVIPLLQCVTETSVATNRASVFRRETIESDAQLFQIGGKRLVRHLGEFVVDECLAETL
jgi:hypothetical protein